MVKSVSWWLCFQWNCIVTLNHDFRLINVERLCWWNNVNTAVFCFKMMELLDVKWKNDSFLIVSMRPSDKLLHQGFVLSHSLFSHWVKKLQVHVQFPHRGIGELLYTNSILCRDLNLCCNQLPQRPISLHDLIYKSLCSGNLQNVSLNGSYLNKLRFSFRNWICEHDQIIAWPTKRESRGLAFNIQQCLATWWSYFRFNSNQFCVYYCAERCVTQIISWNMSLK